MKRKFIVVLCLNILMSLLLLCACMPQHSHSFTQEVASQDYLASAATCTQKAKYYRSCECGIKGFTTFEYGDTLPHSFSNRVILPRYLASDADCSKRATYYFSCQCGEIGTETFEYGDLGSHTFDKAWTYDKSNHWHESTCNHHVKDSEESHTFEDNVCVVCNYDRTVKVSSILLNNSILTLNLGETYALVATVLPRNATNTNIIWSTSSSDVIKVNNGNITAVGSGTAIVTASIDNISATCSVTVNDPYKDYTFETIGNSCTLVAYTGTATTVEIPSEYNDKPVTAIGEKAFYDCAQITKIMLPDTMWVNDMATEGAKKTVTIHTAVRDAALRNEVLRQKGHKCVVCGFDGDKVYGKPMGNIIQVHHLNPIANGERKTTIDDLVPVCPNCHAAIHSKPGGMYTIAEAQEMLKHK